VRSSRLKTIELPVYDSLADFFEEQYVMVALVAISALSTFSFVASIQHARSRQHNARVFRVLQSFWKLLDLVRPTQALLLALHTVARLCPTNRTALSTVLVGLLTMPISDPFVHSDRLPERVDYVRNFGACSVSDGFGWPVPVFTACCARRHAHYVRRYLIDASNAWDLALRCVGSCFVDLQPLAWLSKHMYNLAAVTSLLSLLKVRRVAMVVEQCAGLGCWWLVFSPLGVLAGGCACWFHG